MGVPVVNLAGSRHAGRVGASLLHRVGLDDLVTTDPAAYGTLAAELATNPDQLAALPSGMRDRLAASPLLDGAGTVEVAFFGICPL